MLDPNFVKDHLDEVQSGMANRGLNVTAELQQLATAESHRRRLIPQIEGLKREQTASGDQVARAKRQGQEVAHLFEASKQRGQKIKQGDKVVMWYGGANFDDAVFPDPYAFNVARKNARDHLAFGIGQHFCIGSQLARMQIRVAYEEILARLPDIRATGSYSYLRSNHLSGFKSMPVKFTPA